MKLEQQNLKAGLPENQRLHSGQQARSQENSVLDKHLEDVSSHVSRFGLVMPSVRFLIMG